MSKRAWKAWLLFFCAAVMAFGPVPLGRAYTDEIVLGPEEVWKAVSKAAEYYGVRQMDAEARTLRTKWKQDRVKRSRGVMRRYVSKIARIYQRRYRFDVRVQEFGAHTRVNVKGTFQERPLDAPLWAKWETVKPDVTDDALERDFFARILKEMENARLNPQP